MDKPFKDAISQRDSITKREMRYIRKLYNEWAREVKAEANYLRSLGTSGSFTQERELAKLYYELRNASKQLTRDIERSVRNGASDVGDAVVRTNKKWLNSLGLSTDSFEYRFTIGKKKAINRVLSGHVYKGFNGLSQRIWKIEQGHNKDIYNIIAKGVALDKDVFEIARDIEKYVNPSRRLPWSNVYRDSNGDLVRFPVSNKKVDYNALRLVRTTLQHTYQEVLLELTSDNPFVEGYLWIASGNHPCPICLDRDGRIFKASDVPYDHPNGMCEIEPVIDKEKAMNDIKGFYENPVYYPDVKRFVDIINRY